MLVGYVIVECDVACGQLFCLGCWYNIQTLTACQLKLPSGYLCNKCWSHFDNESHFGKMTKKVQDGTPYVGIHKNHTDQIKMAKKVNLAEMDFFAIFQKLDFWHQYLLLIL